MANITVTNTFSNSTTADAAQVNTNFTDIINGTSDGTKDFSISALTCAGAATLNGAVTLGNATADDITVTGSLSSSIPIKTTNLYDIGSATLGLRSAYISDDGGAARTTRLLGATVAASWTFTFPTGAGTSRYRLETNGSGVTSWQPRRYSAEDVVNAGIAASVAASALTIALKGADGNDPSSTNPVDIPFRSSTAATGTATVRTVTAALSVTVSSGSTLGHVSGQNQYIYVYALDNAGTVELAIAGSRIFDEGVVQTTTAEGGGGAADSATTLYSTTARTDKAIRYIGRLKSSQVTAGTWASAISEISLNSGPNTSGLHYIALNTGNGHGSTATKIRRFSTTAETYGSAITYADSAADGAKFTINKRGLYMVVYVDSSDSVAVPVGVSVNAASLTVNIQDASYANGSRGWNASWAANNATAFSQIYYLNAGDVLRPHTNGAPNTINSQSSVFVISLIAEL